MVATIDHSHIGVALSQCFGSRYPGKATTDYHDMRSSGSVIVRHRGIVLLS